MPFVTDDDVLDRLAAVLKKPSRTDLEPYWATIVERANADAYNEIVRQLVLKGYTQEQVDGPPAWIHGAEYQEALALYWALEYGGGLEEVERPLLEALKEKVDSLKTVLVLDDEGKVLAPFVAGNGKVGFGEMDRTASRLLDPYGTAYPFPDYRAFKRW